MEEGAHKKKKKKEEKQQDNKVWHIACGIY